MKTLQHLAALITAAFAMAAPLKAKAAAIWTALASEKIRPQAPARGDGSASLSAARNEFEAFQVVVTGAATRVSVAASELKGPGTIPAPHLYREELINLRYPSAADGATGAFPDALVPDVDDVVGEKRNAFPFDVKSGESRAVWVEYLVPPDAPAGVYRGAVTVHTDAGDTPVPVQLTVWNITLPSTASLKSAFTLTVGSLMQAHGVSGEALTAIRQKYAQLALDHRISISNIWDDGQRKDFTHIDNAYGPFLDGHASTRLSGARLTSLQSGADLNSLSEHQAWASHSRSKGWFDRLFQYTCDEPPITCQWSDIPARARTARQADPDFRTLVTTDIEQANQNGVASSIDLMTALVNFVDDRGPADYGWTPGGDKSAEYVPFVKSGPRKELWMYESCMSDGCGGTVDIGNPSADQLYFTGWPSYVVDASSVRARAMEWLSFRYGGTGELYYEMAQSYYGNDPWNDIWAFTGNGSGTFFYPGTAGRIGGQTDIPVASIRMKMIREGMEDFEYLKMLADAGGADKAQAIAQQLFPRAWQTDVKASDLMSAREAIAREIVARTAPPAQAAPKSPPPASQPSPTAPSTSSPSSPSATEPSTGASARAAGGGCGSTGNGAVTLAALLPLAWGLRRRRV